MNEVLQYLVSFSIFVILQSLFINGVKEAFAEGNILNPVAEWLKKIIKNTWYHKPVFSCVRCMGSFWGALTFFPAVIYLFGFRWIEIPVYLFDVGILSFLNYFFYKRA